MATDLLRRQELHRPRPAVHGRRTLAIATLLAGGGALLPWITTAVGATFWGFQGGGTLVIYAACLGLAGTLQRRPRLMALHAGALALVAVAVTSWQVARLVESCPLGACMPAIGLVLTAVGGVVACRATWQLWSAPVPASRRGGTA